MKRIISVIVSLTVFCLVNVSVVSAQELSGYIAIEGRGFFHEAQYSGQKRDSGSLAFQPEYYHEWKNGSSFTFVPFARVDSADPERRHFDIREFNFLWLADKCELRIGIAKVFWGVTEAQHLVDIINQTDLVESIDGEEKLGQPMIHLSVPRDWGVVDLFVLPYFRERTYPGKRGRFRSAAVVDTKRAGYESSANRRHVDAAIRYSNIIGNWDFGLSYFYGTSREPTLSLGTNSEGDSIWIPRYEIIHQGGLDLQYVAGPCLWKFESIYRSGQGEENFFALTGGFEYTFTSVNDSGMDLGILGEWLYDQRGKETTTEYDNDIMLGARLTFNDAASTEALISLVKDLNSEGFFISLESSRRLGNNWKLSIESYLILDSSPEDSLYGMRKDDYIQVGLAYYF